jgi:hypothetical protein
LGFMKGQRAEKAKAEEIEKGVCMNAKSTEAF